MSRRSKRKRKRGRRGAGAAAVGLAGAPGRQSLPVQAGPTESAGQKWGGYESIGVVEVIHSTEKALLIRHEGADLWVPKSQVSGDSPVVGELVELWVTSWLVRNLSKNKDARRKDQKRKLQEYKAKKKSQRRAASAIATAGFSSGPQTARTSDYQTPVNSHGEAVF